MIQQKTWSISVLIEETKGTALLIPKCEHWHLPPDAWLKRYCMLRAGHAGAHVDDDHQSFEIGCLGDGWEESATVGHCDE